ncbi:uncharacterized protein LOC105390982 [Plutella xylostella]|uniref:uncharacterized protein LOC105390982 n=1 Tax=Plutella xylostella TaxID=51655 RepID=UPI00203274AC|nr:uncharacterized protein LOC105390982 [Plutella xylostella]
MSHFGDFIEGVPVKISEKYIRPPKIELPYSVSECGVRARKVLDSTQGHCCTFEQNVLAKLQELRSAKKTKKNERQHRLQLLKEEKQKKLDAIAAAEAEERLKQLSVSEVSYPSTEEISEISPDDKADKNCDTTLTQDQTTEVPSEPNINNEPVHPSCSQPSEPDPSILQPTLVQPHYQASNLLDDPDPLMEYKMKNKAVQIPHYNPSFAKHHMETLTYKDFENDTSSPFDNVELKTINDMELLAQVLQNQMQSGTNCPVPQQYVPEQAYTGVPNCSSQAQMEGIPYIPNAYVEQPIQGADIMYTSPQHYAMGNGYYVPVDNCENAVPVDNVNMYMPNYQYYIPANPYPSTAYYSQPVTETDVNAMSSDPTYIPQPYYFGYPQAPLQYQPNAYSLPSQSVEATQNPSSTTVNTVKSRSRSVPDIVKELNEEIASAKLRAKERSYNASPAPKETLERLPNPIDKMPARLQSLCQRIHGMGFPLDRVARVCSLVGDNDKKIIEGLLLLGELLDLGFPEGRASLALAKHEFNRDKALDELVQ